MEIPYAIFGGGGLPMAAGVSALNRPRSVASPCSLLDKQFATPRPVCYRDRTSVTERWLSGRKRRFANWKQQNADLHICKRF
jgi:hypothetical protein